MPLGVGEEFAGYTIVNRLGAGGMGEVYLAQHPRLPRRDALKLLTSQASTDPAFRERFLREAELASALWHPHIVGVHDRGEYDGNLWISMDFVDGEDAGELLARRYPAGMPTELVTDIVTAVASALDYAHKRGLLHRDVKPANIMLTDVDDVSQRRILLTDFGIARHADEASGLTATNTTLGTFAYSAPEQLMGKALDGRADQYALAASAYQLLTGNTMFGQTTPAAMIGSHLNNAPPRLSDHRPELAALDPVLSAALAKNPEDRFALCSDFARALSEQAADRAASITPSAPTTPAPVGQPVAAGPTVPANAVDKPRRILAGVPLAAVIGVGATALALAGVIAFVVSKTTSQPSAPIASAPAASSEQTRVPATVTVPAPPSSPATVTVTKAPPQAPTPAEEPGGDLGLGVPMSYPKCDGLGIVVLGSVTTPGKYAAGVQRFLTQYPGASYLRTSLSCPSLRQETEDGHPIYAVFYPVGYGRSQLCAAVRQVGGEAYGKWLDMTTPADERIIC